ncbi:MAG: NADH-quinone oxidoreductase subunit K, partial [Thermodesulfobacteriota bacterium]
MIPLEHFLTLAAILFVIGVIGVITRRNAIIMYMC